MELNTKNAYNQWANTYDSVINKTRDLEGVALHNILHEINFETVLEIGCGTGKNTEWFAENAKEVTAVDISSEMLAKAKEKTASDKINFVQANIENDWTFVNDRFFDLVSFSLVLEHIENLVPVFKKVSAHLNTGGYLYVGELHPFKQYTGTKARFETEAGTQIVDCFNHHISDFIEAANINGLKLVVFKEYFDGNNSTGLPRILGLLFQK